MLNFQDIIAKPDIHTPTDIYNYFYSRKWNDWVSEYENETNSLNGYITCQGFFGFQFIIDFNEHEEETEYPCSKLPDTRVVAAFGLSSEHMANNTNRRRMKSYLGNSSVAYAHFGKGYTKGHFIAHKMGGDVDVNLFPQIGHINMGRSIEGKKFREMERYVAAHPGTFVFARPVYRDFSACPYALEYGFCDDSMNFVTATFTNKPIA